VADGLAEQIRKIAHVTYVVEVSMAAADLAVSGDVAGDHRHACGERLEHRKTKRLEARVHHAAGRTRIQPGQLRTVVHDAAKPDPSGRRSVGELLAARPPERADRQQRRKIRIVRKDRNEPIPVFVRMVVGD